MCGEIGLKIHEFDELTPRQFYNYITGYRRSEFEAFKIKAVLFRDLEFAIAAPYLDKKHNIKNAQDYKAFPWEKEMPDVNRKFKTRAELEAMNPGIKE